MSEADIWQIMEKTGLKKSVELAKKYLNSKDAIQPNQQMELT